MAPAYHENQGESLDCHGFIDAVYNVKKLAPLLAEYTQPSKVYCSSEELFAPLFRFNYEDLFEYHEVNLVRTKEHQWLQQFASSIDSTKSWHNIIYKRNTSRLLLSKILILYFHCFRIMSIHLTCRFRQ